MNYVGADLHKKTIALNIRTTKTPRYLEVRAHRFRFPWSSVRRPPERLPKPLPTSRKSRHFRPLTARQESVKKITESLDPI